MLLVCMVLVSCSCGRPPALAEHDRSPRLQTIPGTVETISLMPVSHNGNVIWISTTEITWDLYDLFVYGGNEIEQSDFDAVTRPTQPYIAMDRGFGRSGYPAISMSFRGAQQFCQWLSHRTGQSYRLPTVEEWQAACAFDETLNLDDYAWHAGNADRKTHPVASKQPNARGLHDMLGNVAEWCVDERGEGVVMGGSFRDPAEIINCTHAQHTSPAWNASDPQFPPSQWWLADAPFVGFRVVLESE